MAIKERWQRYKPLPEDILQKVDELKPFFQEKGMFLAYLFGSLVNSKGNDVDMALLYDGDFAGMREDLQKRLGSWRLDIVNLKVAPIWLAFEIISSGKIIFKINTETENSFEMNILKQYHDLKPVRNKQLLYLKENMGLGI